MAKLLVIYPPPKDVSAFAAAYQRHLQLGERKLVGATKIETVKIAGAPGGPAPYHQISEVSFPSLAVLMECAGTKGASEMLAHAAEISTGGPPVVLIAE